MPQHAAQRPEIFEMWVSGATHFLVVQQTSVFFSFNPPPLLFQHPQLPPQLRTSGEQELLHIVSYVQLGKALGTFCVAWPHKVRQRVGNPITLFVLWLSTKDAILKDRVSVVVSCQVLGSLLQKISLLLLPPKCGSNQNHVHVRPEQSSAIQMLPRAL